MASKSHRVLDVTPRTCNVGLFIGGIFSSVMKDLKMQSFWVFQGDPKSNDHCLYQRHTQRWEGPCPLRQNVNGCSLKPRKLLWEVWRRTFCLLEPFQEASTQPCLPPPECQREKCLMLSATLFMALYSFVTFCLGNHGVTHTRPGPWQSNINTSKK